MNQKNDENSQRMLNMAKWLIINLYIPRWYNNLCLGPDVTISRWKHAFQSSRTTSSSIVDNKVPQKVWFHISFPTFYGSLIGYT